MSYCPLLISDRFGQYGHVLNPTILKNKVLSMGLEDRFGQYDHAFLLRHLKIMSPMSLEDLVDLLL